MHAQGRLAATAANHRGLKPLLRMPLLRMVGLLLALALTLPAARPAHAQIPAPAGNSDAFVEAAIDRTDPYLGQEVIYTFRYYEALDALRLPGILVGQPDYKAPDFSGFWQEGEIEQTNFQQTIGGRRYNVSELQTRLFPTAPGSVLVPPAQLFLRGLPGSPEQVLETLPIALAVRPLPEGAPEGFAGAVGDFRLVAQVDRTITNAGEPITLRLTLSGLGNIRMAPAPLLPPLDGWRVLEQGEAVQVDTGGAETLGLRTFDYLLLPALGGGTTLPALDYHFFDPAAAAYRSTTTEPIALTVTGAPTPTFTPAPPTATPLPGETATPSAAALLLSTGEPSPAAAARFPMLVSTVQPRRWGALTASPWYWALWLGPLAALLLGVGAARRERTAHARQTARRQARAGQDALRSLAAQRTGRAAPAANPAAAAPAAAETVTRAQRILSDYLSRKLGRSVDGMTRAARAAALAERGVPGPLVARVQECYALAELARFSPAGVDPTLAAQTQRAVEAVVRDLEKVL